MSPQMDLERVYDQHAQALFAFLLNLTRNEDDTREALQEVFVKLAKQPELLNQARDERAFLLRLTHNVAIDLIRRRSTREQYQQQFGEQESPATAMGDDPDQQEFGTALSAALGELPADQRVVVHLKLWEGLTFEQIAETLDVSPNTAASRYRYGLDKLREALRPIYDEIQ